MDILKRLWVVCVLLFLSQFMAAQELRFELKQNENLNFLFNTIQKYQTGITLMNATTLNVVSENQIWNLFVFARTQTPGEWDLVGSPYSTQGQHPPIDILELRFDNTFNTAQINDFMPLQEEGNPVYIIGSPNADPAVDCPGQGTNTPGSYFVQPGCFRFTVHIRIRPGFELQPGLYTLEIVYNLMEDL